MNACDGQALCQGSLAFSMVSDKVSDLAWPKVVRDFMVAHQLQRIIDIHLYKCLAVTVPYPESISCLGHLVFR